MTNTIPNVPRELLERVLYLMDNYIGTTHHEEDELRALLSAPSPAGVDGLEVFITDCATCVDVVPAKTISDAKVVLAKDAQAIIDGLRGEVAGLRKRAKTAEREAGSALRTYKGLEKVARVVSDNSDQVCGELNVLRQQFDQQARRLGELEGLLLRVQVSLSLDDTEWGYSGAEKYKLLADIRAALSAGKEGE